jgi:DNA-binding NarL/FixJ family response regulator
MLEGIRSILETVFEVVVMVSDEGSLIESLQRINPDVVVADLSMPMTRGVSVVRRVKKIKPEMKVIVLSVHDEPLVVEDCMSSGASGFVLKRTAADDIIPAVCEVLRGRTYVSPSAEADG